MTGIGQSNDILGSNNADQREKIVQLLITAYWMEIETVMNYIQASTNLDGIRAQEITESLSDDIQEELGHAQQFAQRIKDLYGIVPGSAEFSAEQRALQPPQKSTDVVSVIKGVMEAEKGGINHYNKIIEACDGVDWVTQDMVVAILEDEQNHYRTFESFLKEFEDA
jgi:bacterioferritin